MNAEWTLNLLDPEFRKDPYPTLARLREEDPVHTPSGAPGPSRATRT